MQGGAGSIPGQGTKIPHTVAKNKKKKKNPKALRLRDPHQAQNQRPPRAWLWDGEKVLNALLLFPRLGKGILILWS